LEVEAMPVLFLLLPLAGVFALNLLSRRAAESAAPWLVGLVCILQLVFAATAQMECWQSANELLIRLFPLGLALGHLTSVMLFVIAMVTMVANAVGFDGDARKKILARSLLLISMSGMNGVVMVRDLLSVYVFLEITAVSCFVLIAVDKKAEALAGAFKYFILSGLATLSMLLANGIIFMLVGSLKFADVGSVLSTVGVELKLALIFYVIALCVKAGVAPFHGWLPDAHASAPNAVSVLLSGVVIKVAGAYLVLRLTDDVFAGQGASGLAFMVLGAFSIVIGAFGAMAQTDMKRVLAFSSVSQMGYIVMAAGLGSPLALIGAVAHIFNHAMFKSLLFVNAAAVKEQTGTTTLDQLGGLTERMPVTGWTSVVGLLSAAGLPPTSGFWSKLLIIMALCQAGQWIFAGIALGMSVVTLGYLLILQRNVFFGKLRAGLEDLREARVSLQCAALVLAAMTAALGVVFPFLLMVLHNFGLV
jgi:multicomponent Na+:H+ antiporter subunit D